MIKLSIAIPTYNRAKYLNDTLESVYAEINGCRESRIEVVVSDNNSTDETCEIVSRYNDYGIKYIKNRQNLGFDANIDLLAKNCNGEYILYLSDDDILVKGSLNNYIDAISSGVSVAYGAAIFASHDMKEVVIGFKDRSFEPFSDSKFYYFQSGAEYLKFTKKLYCGISGTMFKLSDYMEFNMSDFIGSQFLHVGALLMIMTKLGNSMCVINIPTVKYRLGDVETKIKNQDSIMLVGLGLLDLLRKLSVYYPWEIFGVIYNKELNWVRKLLLGVKAREKVHNNVLKKYNELLLPNRDFQIFDHIINFVPHWPLAYLYKAYKQFR